MTATISSAALGTYGATVTGSDSLQRNGIGDQVFVNTTTGNLVVRVQDEFLTSQGLGTALLRTYNAQGILDGDNNDGWRIGVYRRLHSLTGTTNTPGSTIVKMHGDGAETLFTYDSTRALYTSTAGEGAHDTLVFSGGTWTYSDGSGLTTEAYGSNGQLLNIADSDGNTTNFTYAGSLVTQITDSSGQITYLDYDGTNLTQIRVVSQSITQTRTRYSYDTQNRLQTVRVDLSPEDNSVVDGKVFTTNYTYEGTSKRIASVTQGNGQSIAFTYELIAGEYRVKSYTDGEGRATTLIYTGVTSGSSGTANANAAALSTTTTQTTNTTHTLNGGTLATPPAGWGAASLLENSTTIAGDPKTGFDANGNGFAVWRQGGDVFVRRYDRINNSWGPQIALDARSNAVYAPSLSVDAQGDAIVAWVQSDGTASSVYASIYKSATGTWTAPSLLETSALAVSTTSDTVVTSVQGNRMAVGWLQTDGTRNDLHVARYDGTAWSAAQLVENSTQVAAQPSLAIDIQGNVLALWQQSDGTANSIYSSRFNAISNAWSNPALLESSSTATADPRVAIDGNNNAIAIWRQSSDLLARRYIAATDSWTTQVIVDSRTSAVAAPALGIDWEGNAIAAWVQNDGTANSVYASRFNIATGAWSTATLLETSSQSVSSTANTLVVSTYGSNSVVGWLQHDGTRNNLYVARFANNAWEAPALAESSDLGGVAQPSIALDPQGNLTVLWQQTDGTASSVYARRYSASPGTPYYTVPSAATWASIAQALYGTASAASALQTVLGNPALTAGVNLTGMPASLNVTTTTSMDVPAHYLVKTGDTWATITQAIYGTSSPAAVSALQAVLGNPALTVDAKLTVPQTLAYGITSAGNAMRVDIKTPLGLTSTIQNDANGRLEYVYGPSASGTQLQIRYAYDAAGNAISITEDPNGLSRTTTFEYDSRGNLTLSRDAAGSTIRRTYSPTNQVLTETRYTVADPDGAGTGQPSGSLTTRYTYDAERHLRFVIEADGSVTEHRYNTAGNRIATLRYAGGRYAVSVLGVTAELTEAQLNTWVGTQDRTQLERTDYTYDFRGNVDTSISYGATDATGAGIASTAAITRLVYDQRGQLLKRVDARGESTSDTSDYTTTYILDGMGRVRSTTEWLVNGSTRTTLVDFDDANRRTVTTHANGLVSTSNYNGAGELMSVVNTGPAAAGLGTTTYQYDRNGRLRSIVDPTGMRTHVLYDEAGRKAAEIDGDGTFTEYVYNGTGQPIKVITYADRLNGATRSSLVDSDGSPATVPIAELRDSLASLPGRNPAQDSITRMTYDKAGRLVHTVDDTGAVTQTFYDGAGRITDVVAYATLVSIARTTDEILPTGLVVTTSINDRRTRNFYDATGKLIATLDAAGYLVEYTYDGAGRLTRTMAYANATPSTYRSTGTLAQLRPAVDDETTIDPERDIVSHLFYDGHGRKTGALDGEGQLSERVYDLRGNVVEEIQYAATGLAYDTFARLKQQVANGAFLKTVRQYDGANRLTRETGSDGTVTEFRYDSADRLISTTRALGTLEARTTQARYDAMGRVTAELTAQGSALITGGMTQTQIDAVWNLYSVRHAYDQAGRRISSTDQNGYRTLYYYDADSRRTHIINPEGEVTEVRYDARGRITDTINYATAISTSGLSGGLVDLTLTNRIVPDATRDGRASVTYSYETYGQKITTSTAENSSHIEQYNAFGQVFTRFDTIDAAANVTRQTTHSYDKRGLLTQTRRDNGGINQTQNNEYDAFGRLTRSYDQNNRSHRTEYDRVGRAVASVDPLNQRRITTYDAFNRVLTTRDALQNTTTYAYDNAQRKMTVTTPEGVQVITILNRHGQTLSVTDAIGNTSTYSYDVNGQLDITYDSIAAEDGMPLEDRNYDRAGRLMEVINGEAVWTSFTYDGANRTLTRIVDSGYDGMRLTTRYVYDDQGRVTDVTDPNGVLTRTEYDRQGRITSTTVDPDGVSRSRTSYTYDGTGNVLTVTEGDGSANPRKVEYTYDKLGRRTREVIDPGTGRLNLTTRYYYDANGNLTRKIDARNASTWYVYDDLARLRFTVDALGGVTETSHDAENRVVATRRFASTLVASGFGNQVTAAQITVTQSTADRLGQSVYDKDGRERYVVDAAGGVTRKEYDGNGNVTRTIQYAKAIPVAIYIDIAQLETALTTAGVTPPSASSEDRLQRTEYDLRGRPVFDIDGKGAVVSYRYDLVDNLVATTEYAAFWTGSALIAEWASAQATDARNRITRTWYDGANRPVFTLDAEGYFKETRYDAVNRRTSEIVYETKPDLYAYALTHAVRQNVVVRNMNAAVDQVTAMQYDTAGRLASVTDAAGITEHYGYDAQGNRTSFTDKKGAVWTYEYDANGRLTYERSPVVAVTTVSESGASLVSSTANASIVTYIQYDAMGNVLRRTEGYGTTQARATDYQYDTLGRQTRTTHAAAGIYNAATDDATRAGTAVVRTETTVSPITEVAYDALGNAYRTKSAVGGYSFTVLDQARRLTFEVDAANYVTRRTYDAFGNEVELRRYANALSASLPTNTASVSASQVEALLTADAARDRVITTKYDRLGRAERITQPSTSNFAPNAASAGGTTFTASAVTLLEYNAFGEVVLQRDLVNPTTSTYAQTYFYYDRRGQQRAQVDALGYLTVFKYDETGDLEQKTEYARALTTGTWNSTSYGTPATTTRTNQPEHSAGYDRVVDYRYDLMNRLVSETLVDVEYTTVSGNTSTSVFGNQTTTRGYDALGNLTRVTNAANASTYTYYNALGQITAIAQPQRDVDGSATTQLLTPLSVIRRNHFGEMVEEIAYTHGAASAPETTYTPGASSATDRSTKFLFNKHGNIIRTEDGAGIDRYASYNLSGQIAKEWQYITNASGATETIVTIRRYDALGQEIAIVEPQRIAVAPTVTLGSVASASLTSTWEYDGYYYYSWNGTNVVNLSYASIGTQAVQVQIDYETHVDGALETRTFSKNYSNVPTSVSVSWSENTAPIPDIPPAGGIGKVLRVRVLGQDASGNYNAVLRSIETTTPATPLVVTKEARYNAFGEVEAKGINSGWQEYFDYDQAGRIWRTNSGDGIDKVFLYDLAGNATLEVRSQQRDLKTAVSSTAGLSSLAANEQMRTETVYDLLGRVVQRRLPVFTPASDLETIDAAVSIGQTAGPQNPNAVYREIRYYDDYSNAYTHSEYVVDPLATLADSGGYYLNNGYYNQDPNHKIVTRPRISWNAPASAGVVARFVYRENGSGAWTELPVGHLGENKLGVDVSALVNSAGRLYEYRITYSRAPENTIFAEATGTFRVDGTTNSSISISQTPADPAAEIPTLATTHGNAALSWTAPSDSTVTAVLRLKPASGSSWADFTAVRQSGSFRVTPPMLATAGIYDYEIVHYRGSAVIAKKVGQLSSTGTGPVRNVTNQNLTQEPFYPIQYTVDGVTGSGGGSTIAAIVSSSEQQVISEWAGDTYYFTGENRINFSWASLGSSRVRIVIDYLPHESSHQQGPLSHTYLTAAGATSFVSQWSDGNSDWGGISRITRIRLYTETYANSNDWSLRLDQNNPPGDAGKTIHWTIPPADAGIVASFEIKPQGSGSFTALAIQTSSTKWKVDINNQPVGNHEYRIRYRVGNRVISEQTGVVNITSATLGITTTATVTPGGAPPAAESVANVTAVSATTTAVVAPGTPPVAAEGVAQVSGVGSIPPANASIGSSASFYISYEWTGDYWSWTGLNTINVSYQNIGNIPFKLRIEYETLQDADGVAPVEVRDFMTAVMSNKPTGASYSWDGGGYGNVYEIPVPAGGIGRINRVRVMGQDGSGNYTVTLRDTASPSGGVGLTWAAPSDPAFNSFRFQYRSGSSWITLPVTRSGNALNVTLSGIPSGQYEYRIFHQRSGEAFSASTASGYFTTNGISVSRDSQSNGSEQPAWISVSQSGGSVTWAQAPESGASVTFEYWNGSNWVARSASTANGTNYSVSMAGLSGTYSYRIRYTRAGATTPYREATGSVTASTSAGASASIGSSASFYISYEWAGDFWSWTGLNTINVNYQNIGNIPFKLRIEYDTLADADGVAPVETRDFTTAVMSNKPTSASYSWDGGGNGNVYDIPVPAGGIGRIKRVRVMGQDTSGQYTVTLRDTASPIGGVGLTWAAPSDPAFNAFRFFYRSGSTWIERSVTRSGSSLNVDLAGIPSGQYEYRIYHQRSGETFYASTANGYFTTNGTTVSRDSQSNGSEQPIWIPVSHSGGSVTWAQAPEAGATVSFEYWNGSAWSARSVSTSNGTNYSVNMAGLAGTYQYRIRYTRSGATSPYREATGTVGVSSVQSGTPAAANVTTQSNIAIPTVRFTNVSISGERLSWNYAAEAGSTVKVRYWFDNQAQTVYESTASGTSPDFWTTFPQLPTGQHVIHYRILYLRSGETDPYAQANGRATVTLSTPTMPATLTINSQAADYPSGLLQIAAPTDIGGSRMAWTTAAESGATVSFEYWASGGQRVALPATAHGTGYRVDTSLLPVGQYSYEILYKRSGASSAYARAAGTFSIARSDSYSNLAHSDTTASTQAPTTLAPVQKQTLDRWGNVVALTDAASSTTNYRFDQRNQLIETRLASANVVDTRNGGVTGTGTPTRAVIRNYYDLAGRLIAARDANGNLTRNTLNAAGQTLQETRADAGSTTIRYDAFGNQVEVTDALGFRTRSVYDRANRLIAVASEIARSSSGTLRGFRYADPANLEGYLPADIVINRYAYDEAGRRIAETNGEGEVTRYHYDLHGNLTRRYTPMWGVNDYEYDAYGNKTRMIDAIGADMTWSFDASKQHDYFHRVSSHSDLGDTLFSYTYNEAGAMLTQTSSIGQNTKYTYDTAGQLSRIVEASVGSEGFDGLDRTTIYGYDIAGRRTREKTKIGSNTATTSYDRTHQDLRITYDALGRISDLRDLRYTLRYSYDAQGNRTRIHSTYFDHQQAQQTQDLWYAYDAMNRVVVSQGVNDNGTIKIGTTQGISLGYDSMGQRRTMQTYGSQRIVYENIQTEEYDGSWSGYGHYKHEAGLYDERYTYDGLGRLSTVEHTGLNREAIGTHEVTETARTWITASYQYDKASRQVVDNTLTVENYELVERNRNSVFDDDGRMSGQTTYRRGYNYLMQRETQVNYSYDAANVLRSYNVQSYDFRASNNKLKLTTTYTHTYRAGSTYMETGQASQSSGTGAPLPGATERRYNVNGELTAFIDTKDRKTNRYFANGANGQPITAVQGNYSTADMQEEAFGNALLRRDNAVKAQHFFFANGQSVGSFGQLQEAGKFKANFDINYSPVSDGYPANAPSQIVVQAGETLRQIAARVFGDASLWYIIAEENGLVDPDAVLVEGSLLRVPNTVIARSNDAGSYKPFNIGDAIGDTTPTQPAPPPPAGKKCGVIAQIIMVVIAIVVTIYTAGALSGGAGAALAGGGTATSVGGAGVAALSGGLASTSTAITAAAIGGAAGSVASQAVGMAMGVQDQFSWQAVGMAALGSAISAGSGGMLDKVFGKSVPTEGFSWANVGRAAAQGAAGSAASQLSQGKFSWRETAAGAVSSAIGSAVGQGFSGKQFEQGVGLFAKRITMGLATGATRDLVTSGRVYRSNLLSSTVASVGANYIGDYAGSADSFFGDEGSWRHVAAHALLGAGVAHMRDQDAWAGAIGAGVSAAAAPYLNALIGDEMALGVTSQPGRQLFGSLSRLMGAGVAQAFGHDAGVASGAALNTASNNFLTHAKRKRMEAALERLKTNPADRQAQQEYVSLRREDEYTDVLLEKYARNPFNELSEKESAFLTSALMEYEYAEGSDAAHQLYRNARSAVYGGDTIRAPRFTQGESSYTLSWTRLPHYTDPDEAIFRAAERQISYRNSFEYRLAEGVQPATTMFGGGVGWLARFAFAAQGGHQFGQGAAEFGHGDPLQGSLGMAAGTLTLATAMYVPARGMMPGVDAGLKWGSGIKVQGLRWENYLFNQLPAGSRLPPNFKTFDFFDELSSTAISAKTIDTTTKAKITRPEQIYTSLKNSIDVTTKFKSYELSNVTLSASQISSRQLQVAVPKSTTTAQWEQIQKAVEYGKSKNVQVIVISVR
ncbi:MAG: LysM peptidoglycan-binding domain-containing protein [Moraxellaceae bacterium]|nr:LysM peptidoglycan-binding domain-containing protein [Moraxellaceae bacterium]